VSAGRRPGVTFVVDSPNWGGAEVVVATLLEGLAPRWRTSLVAVAPVHPRLAATAERWGPFVPLQPRRHRLAAADVHAAVAATRPAAVVVNLVDPSSNRVLIEAAPGPWSSVATVHMTGIVVERQRHALGQAYQRLDRVIAVSQQIGKLLIEELAVPPDRIALVHNGVRPPRRISRSGSGHGRSVVGVGRLTTQKGWDVLIEATRLLRRRGVELDVAIAGDGRDRHALELAAGDLPVRFVGHLEDVAGHLAGGDVFCLPSRAEGLPLALLEAMSVGLPCVATAVGEVPAVLGQAIAVVPPDDVEALAGALGTLVADAALRRHLGARAERLVTTEFHSSRMVADVEALLLALLPPPSGG
jgi:glycosyltransferase involved in cell wall biosynthesis